MNTKLVSKIVVAAVIGMNAAAYAEEGFNLNGITKDTLAQAYVGEGKAEGVHSAAVSYAAEKSGLTAAAKSATAVSVKPAIAANVPLPAAADNKQYTGAPPSGAGAHMLKDAVLFIPRVVASVLFAPVALVCIIADRTGPAWVSLAYRALWG